MFDVGRLQYDVSVVFPVFPGHGGGWAFACSRKDRCQETTKSQAVGQVACPTRTPAAVIAPPSHLIYAGFDVGMLCGKQRGVAIRGGWCDRL